MSWALLIEPSSVAVEEIEGACEDGESIAVAGLMADEESSALRG